MQGPTIARVGRGLQREQQKNGEDSARFRTLMIVTAFQWLGAGLTRSPNWAARCFAFVSRSLQSSRFREILRCFPSPPIRRSPVPVFPHPAWIPATCLLGSKAVFLRYSPTVHLVAIPIYLRTQCPSHYKLRPCWNDYLLLFPPPGVVTLLPLPNTLRIISMGLSTP